LHVPFAVVGILGASIPIWENEQTKTIQDQPIIFNGRNWIMEYKALFFSYCSRYVHTSLLIDIHCSCCVIFLNGYLYYKKTKEIYWILTAFFGDFHLTTCLIFMLKLYIVTHQIFFSSASTWFHCPLFSPKQNSPLDHKQSWLRYYCLSSICKIFCVLAFVILFYFYFSNSNKQGLR